MQHVDERRYRTLLLANDNVAIHPKRKTRKINHDHAGTDSGPWQCRPGHGPDAQFLQGFTPLLHDPVANIQGNNSEVPPNLQPSKTCQGTPCTDRVQYLVCLEGLEHAAPVCDRDEDAAAGMCIPHAAMYMGMGIATAVLLADAAEHDAALPVATVHGQAVALIELVERRTTPRAPRDQQVLVDIVHGLARRVRHREDDLARLGLGLGLGRWRWRWRRWGAHGTGLRGGERGGHGLWTEGRRGPEALEDSSGMGSDSHQVRERRKPRIRRTSRFGARGGRLGRRGCSLRLWLLLLLLLGHLALTDLTKTIVTKLPVVTRIPVAGLGRMPGKRAGAPLGAEAPSREC